MERRLKFSILVLVASNARLIATTLSVRHAFESFMFMSVLSILQARSRGVLQEH